MDELDYPLFSVTLWSDGTIACTGGKDNKLPDILRIIADSIESGDTKLNIVHGQDDLDPGR